MCVQDTALLSRPGHGRLMAAWLGAAQLQAVQSLKSDTVYMNWGTTKIIIHAF